MRAACWTAGSLCWWFLKAPAVCPSQRRTNTLTTFEYASVFGLFVTSWLVTWNTKVGEDWCPSAEAPDGTLKPFVQIPNSKHFLFTPRIQRAYSLTLSFAGWNCHITRVWKSLCFLTLACCGKTHNLIWLLRFFKFVPSLLFSLHH